MYMKETTLPHTMSTSTFYSPDTRYTRYIACPIHVTALDVSRQWHVTCRV